MITYNHEKFIAQAIESVLMQEVDFDFELVIGEDYSTDRTREIVEDYRHRFSKIIRLILHPQNIGPMANAVATFYACTGDYIALIEGDDYWTSPRKLQRQVEYLDQHPECAECIHKVQVEYEDETPSLDAFKSQAFFNFDKSAYTLEDVLAVRVHLSTCSVMFRNGLFEKFPDWYYPLEIGDIPLHVLNALHGDIGVIDESMATYRVHSGGVWSGGMVSNRWTDEVFRKRIRSLIMVYEALRPIVGPRYDSIMRTKLSMFHYDLVWSYQEKGNLQMMRHHLLEARRSRLFHSQTSRKFVVKAWILSFVPLIFAAYSFLRKRRLIAFN